MASGDTTFGRLLNAFILDIKARADGGLTGVEFVGALFDVGKKASELAAQFLLNDNERKKAEVMQAVLDAYDRLFPLFAVYLPFGSGLILRPIGRQVLSFALDAAIERIYQWAVKPNLPPKAA